MTDRPDLIPADSAVGNDLRATYVGALHNLLDVNIVADGNAGTSYLRAGGGYDAPWTRDAAINSWHAASLLAPDVARDTLRKVCEGDLIAQDDQWWDQIIWVIGAHHHWRRGNPGRGSCCRRQPHRRRRDPGSRDVDRTPRG